MANATNAPATELVYSFPIGAPMPVSHFDRYSVGANLNFAGDKGFLIATCGMCTFAVCEPIAELGAKIYAHALLMIMLWFRITHTIVLDTDKKFYNTFC